MVYSVAEADAYISCILGTMIGVIFLGMFLYLRAKNPEKNIILLHKKLYGKVIGSIINSIINGIVLLFLGIVLYHITSFLLSQYLPETQSLYISLLIILAILYTVTKGIVVMSKANQIFMFIKLALFVISAISLLQYHEIDNLYPFLENGLKNPMIGAILYALFTVSPIFLLTIIDKEKVQEQKGFSKTLIKTYLLSNVVVILIFFITTLVFGIEFISIYHYPEYMVLKKIKIFSSIGRIENILALQFLIDAFVFLSLGVYFCVHSTKAYFKKLDNNLITGIVCIILLILSNFVFKESQQMQQFINQYFLYILGFGFLGIMTLTFVTLFIKNITQKIQAISNKSNE